MKKSSEMSLKDQADKHTEHAVVANRAGDDEKVRYHQAQVAKIKNKLLKLNTVTSENKAEHDKKFMEKQSGKSEDTHPHRVHVKDYDIELDDISKSKFPKEHVEAGLKTHDGKYKGQSDKGYYFGFPQPKNANDFIGHVNTNKYTHAELDNN
jgi:hypothetical protein